MKPQICLSVGHMDDAFRQMKEQLDAVAQVDVIDLGERSLEGCDIFIGKKMSKKMLATADRLKAVFAYKTGVDNFPLEELQKREILLINSHVDSNYVAEYAFGLSISLVNRITEFDKKLRKGVWYDEVNPYWRSFFDMKVGLVGYGHIGKDIHRLLLRNHIETYTIDRGHQYENIHLVSSLEELCEACDLLILSLPKTPHTNKMINEKIFALLEGKYLINVGRSNCIDQGAMYEALVSKKIGGVANDTWDRKPRSINQKLKPSTYNFKDLDNIVISPHQAMRVNDGHNRYVADITEKVMEYIAHGTTRDVVDLKKGY